ncbi:hypothetical protein LZ31DRAFT_294151 [Colletotrichum somersetense]|nr:hypothetical protein LZ31DRAFT_294151 [Colletotrichum somersetense]
MRTFPIRTPYSNCLAIYVFVVVLSFLHSRGGSPSLLLCCCCCCCCWARRYRAAAADSGISSHTPMTRPSLASGPSLLLFLIR